MKRLLPLLIIALLAPAQASDLKADTAASILVGPLVDSADASAETGLTISQADVRLSKNGGDMAQKNDANACTHDELGKYLCALDTTDTNTEGILTVTIGEAGTLVWTRDYTVLSATYYDAKYVGIEDSSDIATAVAVELGDGSAFNSVGIATGGITFGDFAANAITDAAIADDVKVDAVTIEGVDATDAIETAVEAADVDMHFINNVEVCGDGTTTAFDPAECP